MARKTNYSFQKSEREKIRQKKKKGKLDKKQEAKDRRTALQKEGVDPDIADIEAGPQASIEPEE